MKVCFNVIHIDGIDIERDRSNDQVTAVLEPHFENINVAAVNLSTMEMAREFVDKTDGFNFLFTDKHERFDGKVFPHKSGVVGVWASNYVSWKKFEETDNDVLLIFEDDVLVSEDFPECIKMLLDELPEEWDFFSFFVPPEDKLNYNPSIHKIDKPNICLFYQGWSCGGYAISRAGMKKALEDISSNKIDTPIDWYMFEDGIGKFNTYSMKPFIYPKMITFNNEAFTKSYIAETGE